MRLSIELSILKNLYVYSLCDRLNKTFSVQMFVKFGNASILICCIGFVTIVSLVAHSLLNYFKRISIRRSFQFDR